jgi:hypothetical protein
MASNIPIIIFRDVNLNPYERIPAGIAPFGAPEIGIFSLWGRGWRQKFPRVQFGAGTGKLHPAPRIPRIRLYIVNYIIIIITKCWFFFKKKVLKSQSISIIFSSDCKEFWSFTSLPLPSSNFKLPTLEKWLPGY